MMVALRSLAAVVVMGVVAGASARAAPGDIIVTGEKRALELQQTTASVTVLSPAAIAENGLQDVQDAFGRAPNLASTYGPSGFSIRGIANIGVTGAGSAATATIYVDGTPTDYTYLQAAPTDLWDASRVEILRGPQSTLQGLNALAGAVIIETADPLLDRAQLRTRVRVTNEWRQQAAIAVSLPLIANQLAIRLSGERLDRDGFVRNVTRQQGEDREDRTTVRAKLLWAPAAWPGFTAKLTYAHLRRHGGYNLVYARTDVPNYFSNRIATDNQPNRTDLAFDSLSGQLRYAFGNGLALSSLTSWSAAVERDQYDGDFGPVDASFGRQRRRYRTFTQELRLNYDGHPVSGLLGLFYYNRDLASEAASRTDVPTPVATIAALLRGGGLNAVQANGIAGAYGQALPAVRVDFIGAFPTLTRTIAAFGDGRYRLTSRLSLLAGFRFDHEMDRSQNVQQSAFAGSYPNPAGFGTLAPVIAQINAGVAALVAQSNTSLPAVGRSFNSFLPKAGLLMEWNDRLATGFVVQRGYRSGGASTNIARGASVPFNPEYIWNYELSARAKLLGGKLRLSANGFYTDWRQQQVSVNFGLNAFDVNTVNAGASHLYGFELEGQYVPSPRLSLHSALGYTRTRFDQFAVAGIESSLSGSEFAFAPHWTASGGASYHHPTGWDGATTIRYASSAFGNVGANQAAYPVGAHTIVDGRFGYTAAHWSAHLEAQNLFDVGYIAYKSPMEARAVLNAPRTIGVALAANF